MNKVLLLSVILFIVKISIGQFITTFNDTLLPFGSGAYTLKGICQDDSFYYVLGGVNNYQPKWNLMVLKMDKNGVVVNKKKFEDSLLYYAAYPYNSMIISNNSIIYCTTITDSSLEVNGMAMCLDKHTLDTLWTKTYPHPDTASIMSSADKYSTLTAIKATPDNAYILTGNYMTAGNERSYLMKIDSVGNILWTKTYSDVKYLFDIELSVNNGFVFLKKSWYQANNIVFTDSVGNIIFQRMINSGNGGLGNTSYVTKSLNNTYVGLHTYTYSNTPQSMYGLNVYKYDYNSDQIIWDKYFILYESIEFITLQPGLGIESLNDGSIIVSGTVQKDGGRKGFIFKLNSNGDSLWTKTYDFGTHYNNNDRCQLNDLIITDDGGFFGVGFFWDKTSNDVAWMFKTDANGIVGFENSKFESSMFNVFPNPATDFVKIEFKSQKSNILSYKIYNSQGKLVLSKELLVNDFTINIKEFASGVYFIEATTSSGERVVGKFLKE